jgi:hypothetical protein
VDDGSLLGFELPEEYDWQRITRHWWDTWRRSPQSRAFSETDWNFLLETAFLHAELVAGNAQVASELRLRESKLGATLEDRQKLRIQVKQPEVEQPREASGRYAHLRAIGSQ